MDRTVLAIGLLKSGIGPVPRLQDTMDSWLHGKSQETGRKPGQNRPRGPKVELLAQVVWHTAVIASFYRPDTLTKVGKIYPNFDKNLDTDPNQRWKVHRSIKATFCPSYVSTKFWSWSVIMACQSPILQSCRWCHFGVIVVPICYEKYQLTCFGATSTSATE